jgi:hypothetical protein
MIEFRAGLEKNEKKREGKKKKTAQWLNGGERGQSL